MLNRRARGRVALLVAGVCLAGTACGIRVPDSEVNAAEGNSGAVAAEGTTVAGSDAAIPTEATDVTVPGPATTTAGTGAAAPTGSTGTAPSTTTATAGTAGKGNKPAATAAPTVGGACTKQLEPIKLGQTGAFSGLLGQASGLIRLGLAVWARDVNARGGVQCHPIQLFQVDDGSDPARTASNVNDLVQTKGVVSMIGSYVPITLDAYRREVNRLKVPTVGGDGILPPWNEDPLLFPAGTSSDVIYTATAKVLAQATGKTKLGVISCVEASVCPFIAQQVKDAANAAKGGYQVVAQQSSSMTQTDFTAECQNMKNAGAEFLWLALDGASDQRFARSCLAIDYKVPFATVPIALGAASARDPNVRDFGVYFASSLAPFPATDNPGLKEFHAAMARFNPGGPFDGSAMLGWAAGKLFEAGMAKVPQARTGPVATALVLQGLYSLKNETLNGLSPGVTFRAGQGAAKQNCYYTILLNSSGFTAPNGSKKDCF
ncbi:ABC transporter substrate-binding protein [Sporichthya sp.]|uniref:ABC transporter substrate-binding protein n=1 Tax=Sporichthya sp. TaxID=65475 RepID=UPI0017DA0254|nr:ABC transporter substrate-binding protein [Sporichthya sp.]MBA3741475.1 ABC transporter substrate-binding protein [Sporichthya sp.]